MHLHVDADLGQRGLDLHARAAVDGGRLIEEEAETQFLPARSIARGREQGARLVGRVARRRQ